MQKRIWLLLTVLAAWLSMLPVFAAEAGEPFLAPALEEPDTVPDRNGETAELFAAEALTAPVQGTCGSSDDGANLSWTLTPDGILTIRGEGGMAGFGYSTDQSTAPWLEYRSQIQSVVIEQGVTSIGQIAFVYMRIGNFFLPDSLNRVDWGAFYATGIEHVYFAGTQEQWTQINIGSYNTALDDAVMNASPALYVVSYDANGGDGTMASGHYVTGQDYVLPVCGFSAPVSAVPMYYNRFKAWEIDGRQYPAGTAYTFEENTTVKAVWESVKLESGSVNMPKLSREEIAALLAANPFTLPDEIYDEAPSVTAPYRTGRVKTEVLQRAADRLTALRAIAGLPAVELDAALNENAQYGAVLIAASEFSHYPPKPDDMEDDFYQQGYDATSSSNLSTGGNPIAAVDGFMSDLNNVTVGSVGHRNWQLTPKLKKVGFGSAGCTVEKVFDSSGDDIPYQFIGWPASGYFPVSQFSKNTIWSIRLNSEEYHTGTVSATLTRESDGKTWSFSETETYAAANTGKYFTHSGNMITFRPDMEENYDGLYTVSLGGITDINENPVDFTYQVEFFDEREFADTAVKSVTVDGWRKVHMVSGFADAETMEKLAVLLPRDVTITADNGRTVSAQVQGDWTPDPENQRWLNTVDPSVLPERIGDPEGLLNAVSIVCSVDDYTGSFSVSPFEPAAGESGSVSIWRYMLGTDQVELHQIVRSGSGWTDTLRFDEESSAYSVSDSGYCVFDIGAWQTADTGLWVGLYYSSGYSSSEVYIAGMRAFDFGGEPETVAISAVSAADGVVSVQVTGTYGEAALLGAAAYASDGRMLHVELKTVTASDLASGYLSIEADTEQAAYVTAFLLDSGSLKPLCGKESRYL